MDALGTLEMLLMRGEITEDEYRERKREYVEVILELYVMGILTKEEMYERINE